ncbi:flagellar basal body L-ring protein FlgH [Candidatus Saganbacteria bacterium]|nr:flagellar basal body L-ring protein FlgH [Candidatus Saganbacteria bacterium]
MKYNVGICLLLVSCILVISSHADSLWNKNSSSPYSPEKGYKVGDIITIIILESTNAQQKAGTDTNVKDDLGIKLTHTLQRLTPLVGTSNDIAFGNSNKYSGAGSTQRASSVTSKIASTVTEVLDSGNLRVEGHRTLDINDESQEIYISGVVRSKDISGSNTIFSYQVADAQVSIKGTGVIQEAESPGWLSRLLNWLF